MEDIASVCLDLSVGAYCFRCVRFSDNSLLLHEHIPGHRISRDMAIATLHSLVANASGWDSKSILLSSLNKRGQDPERHPVVVGHIDRSVSGVVRCSQNSTKSAATFDFKLRVRRDAPNNSFKPKPLRGSA